MRKGFTLIELLIVLFIIAILGFILFGAIGDIFADPITRVGTVVNREHVVHTDEDGWDTDYWYVSVNYNGTVEKHLASHEIYDLLIVQQEYTITSKGRRLTHAVMVR